MALLFPESDPVFHAARPDPIVVFPTGDVADPSPMNINDGFHRWWYPKNSWFISWKILLKLDDLGVPSFQETSK